MALTAVILFSVCASHGSHAASVFADDPCDPDYYDSLEARAWLEAQREITQNQNLIFKPDSVLEYTCFDGFLEELADHGGTPAASDKLFTATDRWGTPPTNMATSLTNVVAAPANAYIDSNFDHTFLGGRASTDYPLPASVSAGSYTCQSMNDVWLVAKCMDFIVDPANDGFYTFSEYESDSNDKRQLPTACTKTADFQANIDEALIDANTPWDEDDIITYYEIIYPTGGTGGGGACNDTMTSPGHAKIPTGLVVKRQSGGAASLTEYNEYVCVVPGCYYEPTDVNDGNCVQP